jgi:hypothetical protein
MSSEEGHNHIDVPKPYKEQKSPYKDENAEEPEGPKPGALRSCSYECNMQLIVNMQAFCTTSATL